MKQVLVKKENGVLLEPVIVDKSTRRFYPYITASEECFGDILDLESVAKNNGNTIEPIVKTIDPIIKNYFLTEHYGYEFISNLFEAIKRATTKEDLVRIANYFINKLSEIVDKPGQKNSVKLELAKTLKNRFNQQMSKNRDLVLAILIKRIVYIYYRNKFNELIGIKKEKLEILKNSGASPESMLEFLEENWNPNQYPNGVYSLAASVLEQVLENVLSETKTHLCWQDCANARANLCPRIADIEAKRIDQYDIITDGYQTYDSKGKMINFYVTGCKLYRKEIRKPATIEQIRHFNELRASLMMHHYGVGTLEEAKQAEQREERIRRAEEAKKSPGTQTQVGPTKKHKL